MEQIVQSLQEAGFPEAVARDLGAQGHRRRYEPGAVVWKNHVPVEWLILPVGGGGLFTGGYRWEAPSAIRAVVVPEALLADLVCGSLAVDTFLISRSMLILAARYYPEILLGCLRPFAQQKLA